MSTRTECYRTSRRKVNLDTIYIKTTLTKEQVDIVLKVKWKHMTDKVDNTVYIYSRKIMVKKNEKNKKKERRNVPKLLRSFVKFVKN